jgi:D-alanyl-D-alanine carboxypeptidase
MLGRMRILAVVVAACWAALSVPAPPVEAAQLVPPPIAAKAFMLVDADSGRVLDALNEHEALPPASTQKLMTALVATEKLSRDATFTVGVTPTAQQALRIGMNHGEVWSFGPAMHALLMISANDAAAAIAERVGGEADALTPRRERLGAALPQLPGVAAAQLARGAEDAPDHARSAVMLSDEGAGAGAGCGCGAAPLLQQKTSVT